MGVFTHKMLRSWAVCPRCCAPFNTSICPSCGEQEPGRVLPGPSQAQTQIAPLERRETGSGVAVGGLALGALGLVPLLGLAFSVLGVILSIAALRGLQRQGRPTRLALLGLGISLTTSVPGVLIWGWLQSASAAW